MELEIKTFIVDVGKPKRDGWYWLIRSNSKSYAEGGPYKTEQAANKRARKWLEENQHHFIKLP